MEENCLNCKYRGEPFYSEELQREEVRCINNELYSLSVSVPVNNCRHFEKKEETNE